MASNGFLNKIFMGSQKPKSDSVSSQTTPRIPMTYVHAHEIDTDYELSGAGVLSLPWSMRSWLKSHYSRARVLVTTDQKTGNFVRAIIKVCLANLDVYSPHTKFDYRVSINLEKNLGGEWRSIVVQRAPADVKPPHRINDRLNFKHLAYQIDLSQFTSPGANEVNKPALFIFEIFQSQLTRFNRRPKRPTNYPSRFARPNCSDTVSCGATTSPTTSRNSSVGLRTISGFSSRAPRNALPRVLGFETYGFEG